MSSWYQIYGLYLPYLELDLWFEFELEIDRKSMEVYYIYGGLVEAVSSVVGSVIFSFISFILFTIVIKVLCY